MANNSAPICRRKSTHYLKVPLKSTEQIYLVFLIPTLINCIVYILHFSGDLVVAIQHFREKNPVWGSCTIGFMYAPVITYFVLTVSRPDWWMTDDDKVTKGILGWFFLQICHLTAFVLFALYRYAGLIVLSIDAIFLVGEERTKTLNVAASPAAIELYFFLQAWFQALPQAVFQTHLLFREAEVDRTYQYAALDRQISVTPPLPPKNVHVTPPPTPLRGITTVTPLPIPDVPAPPRPDSICAATEHPESEGTTVKSVSVIESSQKLTESSQSLKVPRRKYSSKGLEEDDPIGKLLSFLWWFFFIVARVLAIALSIEFYPLRLGIVLGVHYAIMLMYLFYYAKYYDVITFFVNLWLGLVYIFCLIEYRIKFKYADKWLLPYYVFVLLQNLFLTLTWYFYADWEGFWYTYIFYVIIVSMALCVLSTTVYHALLKPKKRRVYTS